MTEREQQSDSRQEKQGIEQFEDLLFRQKRKKNKFREVVPPLFGVPIADTHAHLDMLANPVLSLSRSGFYNVQFICTIADVYENDATTFDLLEGWIGQARELLDRLDPDRHRLGEVPHVRIAIGCHPHNAKHYTDELELRLRDRLKDPRVCALGEVGLDYYYDLSPRPLQRQAFKRQIQLAHETGLPIILHVRQAHDEALQIMEEEGFPQGGVLLHCFNLDGVVLKPWVDHGCTIAYGGPLTFKNADNVRESVSLVPADKLVVETDSPFMTPEPLRGIPCGPEYVIFTVERLLKVLQANSPEEQSNLLNQIYRNSLDLLDRKALPWQTLS